MISLPIVDCQLPIERTSLITERETNRQSTIGHRQSAMMYIAAALLALAGLADALYLTVQHVSGQMVPCSITGGCSEVLSSSYAVVGGVPLAGLGTAAYFSVFSLATLAAFGYRIAGTLLRPLVAAMVLVSLWLIYLQAFVIGSYCQFCLLSAAITIALLIVVLVAWKKGS